MKKFILTIGFATLVSPQISFAESQNKLSSFIERFRIGSAMFTGNVLTSSRHDVEMTGAGNTLWFNPSGTDTLLGSGWDTIASRVRGFCVDREIPTTTSLPQNIDSNGQDVNLTKLSITSLSQMKKVLNVSASASFSYGIYSAGGEFNLFQDDSVNSFSNYAYISIKVLNYSQVLSQKVLKENRVKQIAENREDFRQACGDEFVSALSLGGVFTFMLKIESQSESHQQAISAVLNGAVAGFGKASGSVNSQLQTLQVLGKITEIVVRKGDDGPLPKVEELEQYVSDFPKRVATKGGKPWVFEAITNTYSTVDNLPNGADPFVYEQQNTYLDGLALLRDVAIQTMNDLKYVYANPEQFESATRNDILEKINITSKSLADINASASACKNKPMTACAGDYPKITAVDVPNRRSSSSAAKLAEVEELFSLRGEPAKIDAAIAILSTIDNFTSTTDERYQAALLLSEALDWKASTNGIAPLNYNPALVQSYKDSLAKTVAFASALPGKPCEGDYLSLTLDGLTNFQTSKEKILAAMDKLSNRSTRTGVSCKSYLWNGIDRWKAWTLWQLSSTAVGTAKDQMKQEAFKAAKASFDSGPSYFPNVAVWSAVHDSDVEQCNILKQFAQSTTPPEFQGVEPYYTKFKVALVDPKENWLQSCR